MKSPQLLTRTISSPVVGLRFSAPFSSSTSSASSPRSSPGSSAAGTVVLVRPSALVGASPFVRADVARVVGWLNAAVGGLPPSPSPDEPGQPLAHDELLYVLMLGPPSRAKEVGAVAIVKHITQAWKMQLTLAPSEMQAGEDSPTTTTALATLLSSPSQASTQQSPHIVRSSSSQLSDLPLTQPMDAEEDEFDVFPLASALKSSSASAASAVPVITATAAAAAAAAAPNSSPVCNHLASSSIGSQVLTSRKRVAEADADGDEIDRDRDNNNKRVRTEPRNIDLDGSPTPSSSPSSALAGVVASPAPSSTLASSPAAAAAVAVSSPTVFAAPVPVLPSAAAAPAANPSPSASPPLPLYPARIGVEKIVVAEKFRRRGLASTLLDHIR